MYLGLQQAERRRLSRRPAPDVLVFVLCLATFSLAQVPEVSPNGHVSIWYPVPYSNGSRPTFNAVDTVVMSYDTQWEDANITMWCLTNESAADSYTGFDLDSPRPSTGNYIIHDLNSEIGATDFPLPCHFALVDTANASDTYAGGTFTMTSTLAAARTWSLNPNATPTTPISTQLKSTAPTTSSTTKEDAPPTATPTSDQLSQSDGASSSSSPGKSLSKGGIAGIVLGCLAFLAILGVLAWWIYRKRKSSSSVIAPPQLDAKPCEHQEPHWKHFSELSNDSAKGTTMSKMMPSLSVRERHEMEAPVAGTPPGAEGGEGRQSSVSVSR